VSEEVLPSIRKTGSYGHQPQPQFDLTNLDPDEMIETLLTIQQLRKHTKPNFSANVSDGDYTDCRNYYLNRMKEG
jgi:prophage antirepressor-like protein